MKWEIVIAAAIIGTAVVLSSVVYKSGRYRYERTKEGSVFDRKTGTLYNGSLIVDFPAATKTARKWTELTVQ